MIKIPVGTEGKFAIIDNDDYQLVSQYRWTENNYGYAVTSSNGNHTLLMHRLILGVTNPKILIDHIFGNKLDNRKSRLRIATKSQNAANGSKHKDNSSGYKGVWYAKSDTRPRRWVAMISVMGKRKNLGYFATPEEAARAYDDAAKKYFGEFAKLNF